MKTLTKSRMIKTISFIFLLSSQITNAQITQTSMGGQSSGTTLQTQNPPEIIHQLVQNGSQKYDFRVRNLRHTGTQSIFMYLWWYGDGSFSFRRQPQHDFFRTGAYAAISVITEGYGTGGPPPILTDATPIQATGSSVPSPRLPQGMNIHIQRYRNAVEGDTMYLIVTYKKPSSFHNPVSGKVQLTIDPTSTLASGLLTTYRNFLPNNEALSLTQAPNVIDLNFSGLLKGERSILIPVEIGVSNKENLSFSAELIINGKEGDASMLSTVDPPKQGSHDPNNMIVNSDEYHNLCQTANRTIKHTVNFQNVGERHTNDVQVICYFDNIIDLTSVTNIKLPKEYVSQTITQLNSSQPLGSSLSPTYYINMTNKTITFNFNGLKLYSPEADDLANLDQTRSCVTFTANAKSNYVFGPPTVSHAVITFDKNEPIKTNTASVQCLDPIHPGGFPDIKVKEKKEMLMEKVKFE